ncbi:LacI family DNA-binding transcriptional regulator [Temperatibacter marinus]|uniref:LacI family DNA-binding transcriptional regulator n=1 Tax=Temperatibacter marinus TaxID=1456591 RepID=A0AA52EE34_9PROT|nr:LacI family DNA-binding transcriptional regulator [Temperatibacter marinus]WND03030.1 LacI family DNA-binding transcriptional regulator [Temperatibacter marinus]
MPEVKKNTDKTDKLLEKAERHKATSYDVAELAGVSQSAVSRCFKPGASVSQKMRDRVMKAAKELGYEPNAIARSLITRRSNLVAIIISNLTNLYYPEVLAQLTQCLSDKGMRVLLFALESESKADEVLQQIWPYQVDGVIAAAKLTDDQLSEFDKRAIPLVFYNRFYTSHAINTVCCDQAEGARQIVNDLVKAGHQSFAFIAGPSDSVVGNERQEAALKRLKQLEQENVTLINGGFSYEAGEGAVTTMHDKLGEFPDAVICVNDMCAIGAIDGLRHDFGKKVPEEVSVVGFDGVGPAGWSSYNLTTVRQPVGRMTDAAVTMLMERIEDAGMPPEKRVFAGVIIPGNSARLAED